MPAPVPLYHEICTRLRELTAGSGLHQPALTRLSLLVTGLVAAKSCVLAQIAAELLALGLTRATQAESLERRLRRALNDPQLTPAGCYHAALRTTLDWAAVLRGSRRVVLALDETSQADRYHLLRMSLPYWGGALPLAWAVWEQQVPLPAGQYWAQVDQVLAAVAALLPAGLEVVVVADRAYDVPPLIDRLTAYGWHWVIRCKANGTGCFRDHQGREHALRDRVRQHVRAPGQRWKARGQVFKKAGWRPASVVAVWAPGTAERLVVLTDLPPHWAVLRLYARRFWIEPGFRTDKSHGWQWEASQVQGVAHQTRLLLALAWASLVTLCLGVQEAQQRLAARAQASTRAHRPQPARQSLFTLGLRAARRWLYRTVEQAVAWWLPELDAVSWRDRWRQHQVYHAWLFQTVRP